MPPSASSAAPAIVVGVDGSRAGVRAALWAAVEAAGQDLPLRLVAAAGHDDTSAAEAAVSAAVAALRTAGSPAEIVTEVIAAGPTLALLEAARHAVMLCVGDVGVHHAAHARLGSTAAALVASARCPVAVVRGGDRPATTGWVVAHLDQTPDSAAVLQYAVAEARLRGAPLRALGTWQSGEHDAEGVQEAGRTVSLQLDRRLEEWRRRYPDLDVGPVAVHGSGLDYLADNAAAIQLVVVGARNADTVAELLGPAGLAALHGSDCSILVVDRQLVL